MPIRPKRMGQNLESVTTKAIWLKRGLSLTLLTVGFVVVLDQVGLNVTSLAQRRARTTSALPSTPSTEETTTTAEDCSYLKDPVGIRDAQKRHRQTISRNTEELAARLAEGQQLELVKATDMPRRNFIDDILFDRMARDGVASAPLTSDAEFIRRVTLDLTGRIPSANEVTQFLADKNSEKRDALIHDLMNSPEYVDKWTIFYGDLLKNNAFNQNINRYRLGRDAFHTWIKNSVASNKSWSRMATELLTSTGDSYTNGAVAFLVGAHIPGGPIQDVYDGNAVEASRAFLGLSSMDCLLCHDGAGHMDLVNVWGAQMTRFDAYGMASFFARYRKTFVTLSQTPFYQSHRVDPDPATGEYTLNTNQGNRSTRSAVRGVTNVPPKYMFGGGTVKQGENRREAFARYLVQDPQFARAHVNYIWEKLMIEGLVSPSHSFDLARLSPEQQLPDGWTLQPANPELLQALAEHFTKSGFDVRDLIMTIVKSNAYQLSSTYAGEWKIDYVPYYARKFVRRLEAEEIHDAIVRATGIPATMADPDNANKTRVGFRMVNDMNPAVTTGWYETAMQLPEPTEPRTNGASNGFMNFFLRGDRDQKLRTDDPSILQALTLMNNTFVTNRSLQNTSVTAAHPETKVYRTAIFEIVNKAGVTNEEIVNTLYLRTLSRQPTQAEMAKIMPRFTANTAAVRQQVAETLQWVLLNKIDFVFNY